ncbi:rhomboid family intramembrane serine protease [Hydrogenophaga sp. 2FB]|uniref:rhomboid family intramembrane serine protease n=1 Tax=Hydrogenophaga sp. 2FB TaxID=2502187 RepID=UPI0014851A02|nr:rhomboid family intramembrane serine protease [Hydrogenophaga sp. 2FB]
MNAQAPSRGWWWLCALHGAASLLMWWGGQNASSGFVWHANDWTRQPWTLWTSAWVHLSTPHLIGNLLALGGVAAAGWVLRPDARCTMAWLLAWPLTQVSLLLWPPVHHAAGLSGLLHAGTLLLAVQLALGTAPVHGARLWGVLLMAGALTKVVLERGWSQPLVWQADTGIQVVQAAHLTGAFWGVLLGLGVAVWQRAGTKKPAEAGL